MFTKYDKALVALLGFVVWYVGLRVGVSNPTYIAVVQLLTALGVYVTPNKL